MVLEVLKQCCLAIRSEKVTERKNGSERLGHLLDNSAITTALDGRPADSFNWSQVFFSARKYFILEARKLEDEERNRPNVSQTVLRNRETHKRTAASLPLLVLKKGCRKTPHIPAQPVIELVLKVLSKREPYLLENFAKEFLLMSVKFVLRFPHFYAQMTTANWKDLLKICVWLYEKNMKNVDPLKVFEVMSGVVQRCQSRVVPHRGPNTALDILRSLPAFLRRVLLSQRVAQHFNMWPTLLHLLLAFMSTMACEWRRVVCALGEDTFDVVLKMWDKRPSPHHTNWLQYMTLLVAIHNPQKDGEVQETSHYSADRARWDRCLRHLYQLLHDHLASSGGKDLRDLTEPLLNLTARVSLQVFSGCEATGFVDVTQLTATASSSKRRKIEVGLTPLTELLKKEGTGTHTLPWYKLLLTLLTNHCKFFTSARCQELLQALKQVLAGCSDRVVQDAVMRCLSVLAVQHSKATAMSRREGEGEGEREGDNLWMSVWDLTLRIVSGRRGNSLGLNLMGTLIWTGLCTPNAASFKLFHKNYLCVSEEALWALLGLLTTVPLPTHFQNEPAWLQKIEDKEPRERLILFALSTPEEEGSGGGGGGGGVFPSLHSPTLLAKVLWCLCLRDPTAVKINHHRHHHHHHHLHLNHHQQTLIEKVDDLCHLSTFTCDLPAPSQVTQVTQQDPSPSSSPSHTPGGGGGGGGGGKEKNVLAEKLQVMIQGVISFAEKVEGESDSEEPECLQALVHLAHLMALLYVHTGDNRLERKFSHTLRLVAAGLEKVSVSEGASRWQTLHPVLTSLTAMLEGPEELAGAVSKGRHKQILSSLPPALPAVLLGLLEKRCTKTPTASATANTQMARGTFSQDSWDDFDIGFDDTLGGASRTLHQDLVDFEETSNRTEGDQRDEDVVVDDLTTLGLRDQCVVVAGRWLVAVADAVPPGGDGGGDTQHTFLHKAVDVVLQMSQCSAPDMGDVTVLLALVQSLFVAEYNEDNILDGLEVISNIAKVHCGVAQVARCSLLYLADLVRRHGSSLSPDIRTSIVTLVKAFATKHQQGNYDRSVTKKIFDVNVELTKVDPKRTWSNYEIPDHDRCGKIIDLLNDNTSELRLYAALSLHLLVGSGGDGGGVVDAAHQDAVFEEVYQIVLESLNVSDTVSEELVGDERETRCVSFLVSLGCVVAASPYLESKALFALCLSNTHHNIDASLLLQLLTCISTAKRTTPQHLLATHLQYLTSQWLQHRHNITAFPCRAFGFDTTDAFLAEHRVALLPVLLECDAKEGVEQLAQGCDGGLKGLFRAAFPLLMARVFPYIAGENATNEGMRFSEAKLQAGRRQYKQVERTFGTEVFSTLLTTHIGDLTLHLLRLTHDPQPWVEGEVIVPPPPPSFTPEIIQATMKFVGGIFRKDGQLLVVVCGRQALHGVVQGVVQAVGRSASPQEARQAITAAAALVDAVLPVLDTALVGRAPYLLRMLLHLLTARLEPLGHLGPHLAHRCLALLHRVVAAALRCLASDLVPAVPILFGRLLPLLTQPGAVGGAGAAGVLGLLLDCDIAAVQAALAALPALPDLPHCPALATLREKHCAVVATCRGQPDLCDEMDNFLATPSQDVATHHLSHLASLLQDSRGQVAELFLGARPGRESRGHRLAQRLVSQVASKGGAVAQEACRCLGELGPLSLDTPVFLVSEGGATPGQVEGEVNLGYVGRLLLAMHGYLACGEVEVEGAAGQALQGVLATQQGQEALEDLPVTPREELRPLCPEGRPRAGAGNSGTVDAVAYQQIVGAGGVWEVGPGPRGYEAWVCGLARCLITAGCGLEVAPPLLPLCALRPEFSALALPLLMHSALATDPGGRRDVLSRQMSAFFARHSQDVGGRGGRAAVQAGLCVVEHLRMQRPPALGRRATTPFDTNHWLALNYLQVAGAAQRCGAHFSALLYLQLHHEQMLRDTTPERGETAITRRLQGAPLARAMGHPEAAEAGQLLLQVCGALEDGAGVQGCIAAGVVQDTAARLALCHHRGDWLAALALCDAAHHRAGLHHTLAALGLHHSLRGLLVSGDALPGPADPGEGGQARWETSWRLCRWEEEDAVAAAAASQVGVGEEGRPHRHIYQALRCLHHHDLPALHHHTTAARTAITTTLSLDRAESTSLMYPLLTHLQILNELEEMGQCVADLSCPVSGVRGLAGVEAAWRGRELMGVVGYRHKEEVMAARVAMLKAVSGVWRDNGRQEEVERMLHRTLLAKSKLARSSGDSARGVVGSEAAILWASQLAVPPELANLTRLEEAEVARAAGDVQRAKHTLTTLLQDVQEGSGQEKVLSQALTFLGELLMEARSLPPHTIIEDYFNRATATLLHHDTDKEAQDILEMSQHRLAQYADQLYQQVHSHLEGDASQAKRATVQRSRAELQRLENLLKGCRENTADWKELSKKTVLLRRNINIDVEFLSELEREEQTYLVTALKAHLSCLAMTSTHHLLAYRVVALWLNNSHKEEVNAMMSEHGSRVKSHHFVPLLYQLVARLSTHNAHLPLTFPSVLSQLLLRVCGDHPHHTLPVIFALAHAHADDQFQQTGRRKNPQVTEEDRVQAAKQLVERLKKTPALREHVVEFERISLAYLSLANWCGTLPRLLAGDKVDIPNSQPLRKLPPIHHTASLTQPLPVQPSAQYSPPLLKDWEGAGMCVGGINAPIRLTVRTCDGAKNFELLKGRDDVRQDAVMEQVFGIVNELLRKSPETRDSGLSMRTYQVVPLSQRSGLIQWCKNTQAFGRYLIGADKKSGAHATYFPKDYTAKTCLDKMKNVKRSSADDKLRVFVDILEHFHPVFQHFFLEQYRSPHSWLQRRLAYTKSVATTSIIGYIVGLGDRHPENILLDKTTAELIHIDLGIAFELGKILPTPETVPFRMTQDMVAGLGVLGIEGPLRGWCEATLRVLRDSGEVLVTLVEVLRHDPLHQWTLTPQQAAKLQEEEEDQEIGCDNSVSMAERVVLKMRQKLVGMEEGFPSSVPDQVTRLLQDATSPSNLCRLFAGWQAYV